MSTTTAVDPRRLARALYLDCQQEGPDVFRVWGGAQSHTVELGPVTRCDCVDFGVNGAQCKHLLRVALAHGDAEVIEALQLLVPFPQTKRRSNGTENHGPTTRVT